MSPSTVTRRSVADRGHEDPLEAVEHPGGGPGGEIEDLEAAVGPAGLLGGDGDQGVGGRQRAGAVVVAHEGSSRGERGGSGVDEGAGAVDGVAHAEHLGVEQGTTGDQATDVRDLQGALPGVEDLLVVAADVTAEQQHRARRSRGDARGVGGGRDLEPGVRRRRPEPARDRDHPDQRVLRRVELEAALGAGAVGERFDEGHDSGVGQGRREPGDRLEGARHPRVGRLDPQQGLPAVEPEGHDVLGVVGGEPVVQLPRCSGETAAVHRAHGEPTVQRAEERELLEDVGTAEHAVDPGVREPGDDPVQQRVAVRGGHRVGADGQLATRGVVGGEQQHPAVLAHQRPPTPVAEGLREPSGLADPGLDEGSVVLVAHGALVVSHRRSPPSTCRSAAARKASSSVRLGMASAQVRREVTSAPAAFASRPVRARAIR